MDDLARKDLIGHLFALVTARLEDAALAAEGQAADGMRADKLVTDIARTVDAASILINAIAVL